jgi:RND family efflux transporter MFP subunit
MYFSPIDTGPGAGLRARRPKVRSIALIALAVSAAVLLCIELFGAGEDAGAAGPPMPTVTVSRPLQRSIVEWDQYVGRFEASQAVEIRPRVSGALQSIHFKDGEVVKKGELLFVIDPRPFNAALAEARARETAAKTDLTLAESDLARASRLIDIQGVSEEEIDSLRARVQSAKAAVAAAQAQVRARALDVEFTRVRAPITGRISDRRVDIGNLVSGGSGAQATLLTTLYALDPIYFSFDGSEALYLKHRRSGGVDGETVEVRLQDEPDYRWKGKVDFTDNAIDSGSGTMRARAVIDNPDYFLAPGMFGNMRLASGEAHPALLVPDAAVQTDQARKVLLVVDAADTVTAKPVTLGPRLGSLRAIRSGLSATDRVVIAGVQFARPGSKVKVRTAAIEVPAAPSQERAISARPASEATLAAR